uniref:Uncharacterized protein n=1 Tax=Globodera rostochiensis TaxID=31243 RepID=A0A914I3P7_GLORO
MNAAAAVGALKCYDALPRAHPYRDADKFPISLWAFRAGRNADKFPISLLPIKVIWPPNNDGLSMSPIRQTFFKALGAPVVVDERDEITRQRLLFTAVLREHFEALFNASGGPEDRAAKWEEIRHLMIEQGTHTLLDKDWKYVAGCYWQNIRKESIRRLAKLRVGSAKQPRPSQLELDEAVSDIISRRGPNALETVLRNYSKWHDDEEGVEQQVQLQLQHRLLQHPVEDDHQLHQQTDMAGLTPTANVERESRHKSDSPVMAEGHEAELVLSNQAALAQLVHNATASSSAITVVSCCSPPSSSSASSTPAKLVLDHNHQQQQLHRQSPSRSSTTPKLQQHHQQHNNLMMNNNSSSSGQSYYTPNAVGVGGVAAAAPIDENPSASLGKLVSRTHSLLLNGGFDGMATDFEQQIRQLVTGYKAWMFDQLFQQDDSDQTSTTLVMVDGTLSGLASSNSNTITASTSATTGIAVSTNSAKRARML